MLDTRLSHQKDNGGIHSYHSMARRLTLATIATVSLSGAVHLVHQVHSIFSLHFFCGEMCAYIIRGHSVELSQTIISPHLGINYAASWALWVQYLLSCKFHTYHSKLKLPPSPSWEGLFRTLGYKGGEGKGELRGLGGPSGPGGPGCPLDNVQVVQWV